MPLLLLLGAGVGTGVIMPSEPCSAVVMWYHTAAIAVVGACGKQCSCSAATAGVISWL